MAPRAIYVSPISPGSPRIFPPATETPGAAPGCVCASAGSGKPADAYDLEDVENGDRVLVVAANVALETGDRACMSVSMIQTLPHTVKGVHTLPKVQLGLVAAKLLSNYDKPMRCSPYLGLLAETSRYGKEAQQYDTGHTAVSYDIAIFCCCILSID